MAYRMTPPTVRHRTTMQVRFFRDRELDALQAAINAWLGERADREIAEIRQSVAADVEGRPEFVVSVWYLEG